jgi:hypothetical protein
MIEDPVEPVAVTGESFVCDVHIVNTYEDGETGYIDEYALPLNPPPVFHESPALDDWAAEELSPLTGTGKYSGTAHYEVTIVRSPGGVLDGRLWEWVG